MTDHHQDLSLSTSSSSDFVKLAIQKTNLELSLDSYSNIFNKAQHNFTASSEISFLDIEEVDKNHNRTFTKELCTTIINAFTGKPISPNPWRKLCTKSQIDQTESNLTEISPSNFEIKQTCQDKSTDKRTSAYYQSDIRRGQFNTRQSRRDTINNQQAIDRTNDDDQALEQFLAEHRAPIVIKHVEKTPVKRRMKKRNSLKEFVHDSSSSPDGNIKEHLTDIYPKVNRSIANDPSWQKLADVYTSEESDEKNHLLSSNTNYTVRLKSEIYTSDQSTRSSSSTSFSPSKIKKDNMKISLNFLESLSEHISIDVKHPDAKPYFLQSGFKTKDKRQELSDKLFSIYNQDVFTSKLSDKVTVAWSGRLTATAGHCTTRRTTHTAVITLSHKVCDSPERCRDTLLHEMCHAAVTLIDGVMEHGHGPLWRQWTRIAEQCYPYLPLISIRHTYDVVYKFIYRCIQCQHEVYRHSKSLNLEVDCCGKCMGVFELFINKNEVNNERQTPKKTPNKYNLYVKEHFQMMKQAQPHLSTSQLMKQLSIEYKKQTQSSGLIDLPELDKLKI